MDVLLAIEGQARRQYHWTVSGDSPRDSIPFLSDSYGRAGIGCEAPGADIIDHAASDE